MQHPYTRRGFLRSAGLTLGAATLGTSFLAPSLRAVATGAARQPGDALPSYLGDVTGNGHLGDSDLSAVRSALGDRRGFDLRPDAGFDTRADIFGRGRVDQLDLQSVRRTVEAFESGALRLEPRPVTVAWHYGWHTHRGRDPALQTAGFLGGDYVSSDPEVEGLFNDLRNEFGITVDALSWISPRARKDVRRNYNRGYLRAPRAETRYAALLYESTISLPVHRSGRIDFESLLTRGQLVEDLRKMGQYFRRIRKHSDARVFELGQRPVLFLYGSHTWGALGSRFEFDALDQAIADGVREFENVYGSRPYLVGEEMLLAQGDRFTEQRRRRSVNFDAIFVYHHASDVNAIIASRHAMSSRYTRRLKRILDLTYEGVEDLRNRTTGRRILVIPSLGAGFYKPGTPELMASREAYGEFLREMIEYHVEHYVEPQFGLRVGTEEHLPAVVYTVGSWNEEFEGHAVFPAAFNHSLERVQQRGFDYAMALKSAFGWNHYAERDIAARPMGRFA